MGRHGVNVTATDGAYTVAGSMVRERRDTAKTAPAPGPVTNVAGVASSAAAPAAKFVAGGRTPPRPPATTTKGASA